MKRLIPFLLVLLLAACSQVGQEEPVAMVDRYLGHQLDESHLIPESAPADRLPCVETWHNAQTVSDSTAHDGGYTISQRVARGPNAGYWHSPRDPESYARASHAYYDGRWTYTNYHAADRFSNVTDISYKQRGTTYWRAAKVITWPDGSRRVERFLNRMRHDNQGPAVVNINAAGDTTYRQCYECDKLKPCAE